ncbi:rRNA-processing protein fcf2-like [Zingiber officinale]|uniref:rRNA-processing protein fcf2-like n=1 Tax=Zingiber officinale TaxID=94328 RepID=UPI001C4BBABB|nr:rRNA-processing protein fcf2-like [Zingiber officinale]XP_042462646.1 rRNA-processing protein fcf2-like [Zingiber officinale]
MPESKSTIGLLWAPKVLPSFGGAKNGSEMLHSQTKDLIEKSSVELVDGLYLPPRDPRKLNKLMKRNAKDTAGRSWFDMSAPKITPEIKNDLEILKLRHVIDPKRHFKRSENSKTVPKYFQVGTVIESASEFFSSRLTKKERKATLADELLHDDALKAYRKRKLREIHESHQTGGHEKWKHKGRQTWKRAKDRRK